MVVAKALFTLEVTLHQDYVCAFTNKPPKTTYPVDNSFLIYMGKMTIETHIQVLMRSFTQAVRYQ